MQFLEIPESFVFVLSAKTENRYSFSEENLSDPTRKYLTIKDLQFTDKGVYKCIAKRNDSTVTKEFTLRVRGELMFF